MWTLPDRTWLLPSLTGNVLNGIIIVVYFIMQVIVGPENRVFFNPDLIYFEFHLNKTEKEREVKRDER